MSVEKNIVERILHHEESGSDLIFRKVSTDLESQLYKLIEYDQGVLFHMFFGSEAGEGDYIFSGPGIRQLTGFDPEEINERLFIDNAESVIDISTDKVADLIQLRSMLSTGKISFYRIEMLLRTRSGEKKRIRETAMPLKDEHSGKITGLIGLLSPVTYSNKSVEVNSSLDDTEKLKNTFLQNISHEVRTPLNAIVGFSSLICEPEETYTKKEEIVKLINNSTDHLLHIVDSIIEISSIEAGSSTIDISVVNPHNIMKRIYASAIKKAGEKNIMLKYTCPDRGTGFIMKTDEYKLYQSMNNLVNNAIKFTPADGSVEFGFYIRENEVEFYTTDTGIGIKDHQKSKIFEKFYQAESGITRRYPGVGLGLTIAGAYIEMLGGKIDCQSSANKGTTFRFTLPSGL
ncbi:MAG TPA: PAS domain-containing sensor histidine kinase [Bacteroidales bacterium]|nr:PAS domain-containing sensor histidine kinase [Bacteroidales bacterium]